MVPAERVWQRVAVIRHDLQHSSLASENFEIVSPPTQR